MNDEQRDYETIYKYWHEHDKGANHSIYEWLDGLVSDRAELARLRTLTAAQSVALEMAGEALRLSEWSDEMEQRFYCPVCSYNREHGHIEGCQMKDALTLIQQAKEKQ